MTTSGPHRPIWDAGVDLAASQMTPDEIAEAKQLAREWKPTKAAPQ